MTSGRVRRQAAKGSTGGRIEQKPTDFRRKHPDSLSTLTYKQLKKRGKIIEQVTTKGVTRYNCIIDGTPRTITLEESYAS